MKPILNRLLTEPAVVIGLLTSIIIAVLAVVTDADWDAALIVAVIGPFAASLGIRPLVAPAHWAADKPDESQRPLTPH